MKLLPTIDPLIPVVNQALAPYFKEIEFELRSMTDDNRRLSLLEYHRYIEGEARKTKRLAVRLQLRINFQALLEKFNPENTFEITVFPKKKQFRVFEGNTCRNAYEEELLSMRNVAF